jgi:uncharacterized membrane protein
MTAPDSPVAAARRRRYRVLLIVPYLWSVAAIPLVNRVHATPLGIPLLLWWALAGVVVTTLSLAVVWRLDQAREAVAAEGEGQ